MPDAIAKAALLGCNGVGVQPVIVAGEAGKGDDIRLVNIEAFEGEVVDPENEG